MSADTGYVPHSLQLGIAYVLRLDWAVFQLCLHCTKAELETRPKCTEIKFPSCEKYGMQDSSFVDG
jgi:hypothetical protein